VAQVLRTWPSAIGLTIEYLAHHDRGPLGAVTFALVRSQSPLPGLALVRCDGYGTVTRACEHPQRIGRLCWQPSATHLTLRDEGRCARHLPRLTVADWVRHPEQPLYGQVTRVGPDGTVDVNFLGGPATFHASQVLRIPPHVAAELDRGPLSRPVYLVDD
jgi:hypothetical protein